MVFREISFWNENVSLLNKNGNVYCWWIVIDSPRVNAENCKLYDAFNKRLHDGFARHLHVIWLCWPYVLQMGRSELKYGFYCQNLAHFLYSCIFQFFIKKALLASNSVQRQNFMGKMLKVIDLMSMIVMVQYITRWPQELMVWGPTPAWGNFFFLVVFFLNIFSFFGRLKLY